MSKGKKTVHSHKRNYIPFIIIAFLLILMLLGILSDILPNTTTKLNNDFSSSIELIPESTDTSSSNDFTGQNDLSSDISTDTFPDIDDETQSVISIEDFETQNEIPTVDDQNISEVDISNESTNLEETIDNIESSEESDQTVQTEQDNNTTTISEQPLESTIIYLTFDDGPSELTPQILDILKNKSINATFFITDYEYNSERENIIKREFEEGHTIGLHGTSHDYSSIYSSLENLIYNYSSLEEKVFNSIGIHSNFIRFPGGTSNTVSKKYCTGIMTEASKYFSENGFTYFDWNVDSNDAGSAKSIEDVYNNTINGLRIGHTNIVLMHDASNKIYTLGALEQIIDYCLSQGYEFRAIDSNTPHIQHPISN